MILYLIKSSLCLIVLLGIYLLFLEREKMHRFNRVFLLCSLLIGLSIPFYTIDIGNVRLITETPAKVIDDISRTSSKFLEEVIEPKEIEQPAVGEKQLSEELIQENTIEEKAATLTKFADNETEKSISTMFPIAKNITNEENNAGNNTIDTIVIAPDSSSKEEFVETQTAEPTIANSFSIKDALLVVYGLVTLILFGRLIFGLHAFYRKRTFGKLIEYGSASLALIPELTVPHTFLNTIYANKDEFETGELSNQILDHELTHAKQKHSLDVLFIELIRIVFWFNPILYFYKRAIQINHEFLADESVIKKTKDFVSYQQLLIESVFPIYKTNLASTFNYSLTKKRFKMMVKESSMLTTISKKIILIPVLLSVGLIFCTEKKTLNGGLYPTVELKMELERIDGQRVTVYKDKQGNLFTGSRELRFVKNDSLFNKSMYEDGIMVSNTVFIKGEKTHKYEYNIVEGKNPLSAYKLERHTEYIDGEEVVLEEWKFPESPEQVGTHRIWYRNGNLKYEATFKQGFKYVGLMTSYDEVGNIKDQERYNEEGELITITMEFMEKKLLEVNIAYNRSVVDYINLKSEGASKKRLELASNELIINYSRLIAFRKKTKEMGYTRPFPPFMLYPEELKKEEANNFISKAHADYKQISLEFDKQEDIYRNTKKDSDLKVYLELYEKKIKLYRELKEIDPTIKVPRPMPIRKEQYERVRGQSNSEVNESSKNSSSPYLGDYLSRLSKYENVVKGYNSGNKTARDILYERIRVVYYHERLTPAEQRIYKVPNLDPSVRGKITLNEEEKKYHSMLGDYLELRETYNERPVDKNDVLYIEFRELKKMYDKLSFYSRIFIVDNLPPGSNKYFMVKDLEKGIINEFEKLWSVSFSELPDTLTIHYINIEGNVVSKRNSELTSSEIDYLKNNARKSNVTQVYPLPDERKPTEDEIKEWQDDYYFKIVLDREEIENSRLLEMDMSKIHHFKIHKVRWNGNRRIPYDYEIQLYSNDAYQEMIKKYRPNKSIIALHDATLID